MRARDDTCVAGHKARGLSSSAHYQCCTLGSCSRLGYPATELAGSRWGSLTVLALRLGMHPAWVDGAKWAVLAAVLPAAHGENTAIPRVLNCSRLLGHSAAHRARVHRCCVLACTCTVGGCGLILVCKLPAMTDEQRWCDARALPSFCRLPTATHLVPLHSAPPCRSPSSPTAALPPNPHHCPTPYRYL